MEGNSCFEFGPAAQIDDRIASPTCPSTTKHNGSSVFGKLDCSLDIRDQNGVVRVGFYEVDQAWIGRCNGATSIVVRQNYHVTWGTIDMVNN